MNTAYPCQLFFFLRKFWSALEKTVLLVSLQACGRGVGEGQVQAKAP